MPLYMIYAMLYAMLYDMLWKQQEFARKSCASQALFLGPVVGGVRMAGSATDSLRWPDSGRVHCQLQRAQQSGLPPRYNKCDSRLWRLSLVAGRVTAIAADLRSLHSLHSRWNNLVWNCARRSRNCARTLPRDRLTAAIYKAVISPSLKLFDSYPCLAKQNGTANAFACLFEKSECESESGTANGLFNSLHCARGVKVKIWNFTTQS